MKVNVAWENEEVPTNGKVLAVASDFYSASAECLRSSRRRLRAVLRRARPGEHPSEVGAVPVANHTAECVLDCQWFYGRAGTIIDARGVLDGSAPTVRGNWIDELRRRASTRRAATTSLRSGPGAADRLPAVRGHHRQREDARRRRRSTRRCSTRASRNAFVHSARWPRQGRDKLVLIGGETNFTGRCDGDNGEFARTARRRSSGKSKTFAGRSTTCSRPATAPTPTASRSRTTSAAPSTGSRSTRRCTNGGLVALSEYEDGVRFMPGRRDGKMTEQGFFAPLGGSSSSSKWAPSGDVVYSLDYDRGIDIIRWRGPHYVPGKRETGRAPGTNGTSVLPAHGRRRAGSPPGARGLAGRPAAGRPASAGSQRRPSE
jgi:hypothetical protein